MSTGKKYWGNINLNEINAAVADGIKPYQGEKGKYIQVQVWVNDEPDQYGNSLSIKIYNKETGKSFYLGNLKLSNYQDGGNQAQASMQAQNVNAAAPMPDDDLPF